MLAFAEKSWLGGGHAQWITNIIDSKSFEEFEERLLDRMQAKFKNFPFPYWRQSDISWNLYGLYNNGDNLNKNFAPDTKLSGLIPAKFVIGGTVILRHFRDPAVRGVIPDPKENTTWYATTEFWSDQDTPGSFALGFIIFPALILQTVLLPVSGII